MSGRLRQNPRLFVIEAIVRLFRQLLYRPLCVSQPSEQTTSSTVISKLFPDANPFLLQGRSLLSSHSLMASLALALIPLCPLNCVFASPGGHLSFLLPLLPSHPLHAPSLSLLSFFSLSLLPLSSLSPILTSSPSLFPHAEMGRLSMTGTKMRTKTKTGTLVFGTASLSPCA